VVMMMFGNFSKIPCVVRGYIGCVDPAWCYFVITMYGANEKHGVGQVRLSLSGGAYSVRAVGDKVVEQIRIERLEFTAQAHRL